MRIIDNGPMCRPEFQYRYKLPENEQWLDFKGDWVEWSYWETAPYVNLMEIEND